MYYVMSGLNGYVEEFRKMLQKVRFTPRDELYLLGDIIGNGPDSFGLLKDLMLRDNVYPLMGKNEYRFIKIFGAIPAAAELSEPSALAALLDDEQKELLAAWISDGGAPIISQYLALSAETREAILDYLEEFMPYEEITCCNKKYLLAYGCISGYEQGKAWEDYPVSAFLAEFSAKMLSALDDNLTLVFGSTPVSKLPDTTYGRIYYGDNFIDVNCEVGNDEVDGLLGCIRLGDERDFYVE